MNDVMSERLRILLAKRSRTRRFNLPTREPPPKDIVLAACVYADNGPHLVVVGRDCHPRSPDDIENSEIARVVDFLYSGALRLAQPFENGRRVRNCASDNLANGFVRCILNQRGTAVGDKLVQVKHRFDPSMYMGLQSLSVAQRPSDGAAEERNELAPLHRADPNPWMDRGTIAGHGRHRSNGGTTHVRLGSGADITRSPSDVRSTPKADIASLPRHVR